MVPWPMELTAAPAMDNAATDKSVTREDPDAHGTNSFWTTGSWSARQEKAEEEYLDVVERRGALFQP